jgi:hypothetical protein
METVMDFDRRFGLYGLAFISLTIYFVHGLYADVEVKRQTDPSAVAILSFVPYLIPIFMAQALALVVPTASVIELCVWWRRR